jgi:cell division protein FtsB
VPFPRTSGGMARRRRSSPFGALTRWLALVVLAACGLLYYQPLSTYLEKRGEVAQRELEVAELRRERASLERQLAQQTSEAAIMRDARRMAYVRPGEQLFIVKGIPEWRRAQATRRARATIGGDG